MRRGTCTSKPVSKLPTHLAQTCHLGEPPLLVLPPRALCGDVIVTNKLSLIYTEHAWGGACTTPQPCLFAHAHHALERPWGSGGMWEAARDKLGPF